MMFVSARSSFRSMTTRLTCFKYRSPAAALRCLAEGSLYFAKPSKLNDTLEAKYDHDTPQNFTRVMAQTYSEIPDGHPNSPTYGHLKLPHLN